MNSVTDTYPVSKEFYLLTGIAFALFIAGQTTDPIFPLYVTDLGASIFELGLIISLFSITAIISRIPLGFLVEKAGKLLIVPISLVGQAVCFFLYSIAPTPNWLYPIRVVHALLLAAFFPVVVAIIADLAPPGKLGDRMGRFLTSFGLALMFGPFLCSFLLRYLDYRQLFRLTATIPILACILFVLAIYKGSYTFPSREKSAFITHDSRSLKKFVFSRNIVILCFLKVSYAFTNAFFLTLFAVHAATNLLFTSSLIAILFGIRGVTNTVFRIPAGKVSDRVGYKLPLNGAFFLLSLAFFFISEAEAFYMLVVAIAVYGVAHGIRAVVEWALLAESTPPALRAPASAYVETMVNIGDSLGAVTAGALSLIFPIPAIFKLGALVLFPAIIIPIFIQQDN